MPGQSSSYAGSDPPPIGFDLITKSDYKSPNPQGFDFSKLSGPSGPSSSHGYSPSPYSQPASHSSGSISMPVPYGGPGYQPAPGGYGFQPSAGYPGSSSQPYQNFPNPAYDAGYQPYPYGQPQPSAPGFSDNQYYNPSYQQPPGHGGYGAPPHGQYSTAPSHSYGFQGSMAPTGQYPSQHPQYPYGQGEAIERTHSGSMLSAEPVSRLQRSHDYVV